MIEYVKDMAPDWGDPNLTGLVESSNWQYVGSVWVYEPTEDPPRAGFAITWIEIIGNKAPKYFCGWIPQSYRWELIDGDWRRGRFAIPDTDDYVLHQELLCASVRIAMTSVPGGIKSEQPPEMGRRLFEQHKGVK
jgi:hypothetical protein